MAECLNCLESLAVRKAALCCIAKISQYRLKHTKHSKPLSMKQPLMICLESLLGCICEETDTSMAFQTLLIVFKLLAEKDRDSSDPGVDMLQLAETLLDPYYLQKGDRDIESPIIWMKGLQALVFADATSAREFISKKNLLSELIEFASDISPKTLTLQLLAAELLVQCMNFVEHRTSIIEMNGIDLLVSICLHSSGSVSLKLAAALARLCTHDDSIRETIFNKMDYITFLT
ncbi:hypothetical protein IE077_002591 [Cardiosporidium cionae]|uniref:Uncharacterized protein n=1 Tax=Cardiosporidium cionae TaxID=476202 RepID=A0ABQ7JAH3_9APIC|nr:hypothetical protein IE077_002591 [Cardiosporidium cionae]|eukprot:KAF8820986.1 hypothetical protein IE077_002591 [Cardiosporidium cionae]